MACQRDQLVDRSGLLGRLVDSATTRGSTGGSLEVDVAIAIPVVQQREELSRRVTLVAGDAPLVGEVV